MAIEITGAAFRPNIHSAEIVLPCEEIPETLAFFTEKLGFQINAIFPADDPSGAVISAHGLRIRLQRGASGGPPHGKPSPGPPGTLRLTCDNLDDLTDRELILTAPNGTRIELVASDHTLTLPPVQQSFVLNQLNNTQQKASPWNTGRAGMLYRDLIPDRQGGRFIASHIKIPDGGPVPDYVHYHTIHFQMIYCYKGWVRVVYEDQGEPFVLEPGDCVLQPPEIRHQVLESAPNTEVIEIGCPAEHLTQVDHELSLPTATFNPFRDFGGHGGAPHGMPLQRFVRHEAATAKWQPWRLEGFECRDIGISHGTGGLASVQVARFSRQPTVPSNNYFYNHNAEFLFIFVLEGTLVLDCEGHSSQQQEATLLAACDCFVIPAQLNYRLRECSHDLQILEIALPADFKLELQVV